MGLIVLIIGGLAALAISLALAYARQIDRARIPEAYAPEEDPFIQQRDEP